MGLVPKFTMADVRAQIQRKLEAIDKETLACFQRLGDKCVTKAKDDRGYQDQTGNLKNSIGYVIIHNGVIIDSALGNSPGSIAQQIVDEHKSKHQQGWVLLVVAGMNYASYVEAYHNRIVLSTAELLAETETPRMLKELSNNINNMR